ncbi:MAG: ExeA family protein [Candidatus Eisenbacteria bacterium]|nr:AAA family ATPase [Candidatus Eisenbacteria bacterium]
MYEEFFGFREAPFQITPDPRFLYLTRSHRDALAYLQYGIQERKGILVLTGEVGTGKTLLVRTLLAELPENVETAVVMNARLTFKQLLYLALLDFGVHPPARTKVELLLSLQEYLLRRRDSGGTALLIVDEAQTLTPESLEEFRLLSNLETSTQKLLQILLVGQPELAATLSQYSLRQLRQRIPGICDLSRLPAESVREYIEHRLQVASGGRCGGLFTPEALWAVTEWSEGIPRLVNQLCDRSLLVAYARGADGIEAEHVHEAIRELDAGFLRPPMEGLQEAPVERRP